MKRLSVLAGLAVAVSIPIFATPSCANLATTGLGWINGDDISDTTDVCTVGAVTFDDFYAVAATGFSTATPFSVTVYATPTGLEFDTTNMASTSEDVEIYFQTDTGTVTTASLTTGPGDTATEYICSAPVTLGSETCDVGTYLVTNGDLDYLQSSGGTISTGSVGTAATDYFVKDDSGGSQFTESFGPATVPEPMTFSLMGAGLLGLGLLGRRLRR